MKNKLNVFRKEIWQLARSPFVAVAAVIGAVMVSAASASAVTITTNVTSDFASVKSTLEGYIVAGAVMVVTLALIVIGILMIVRWARRAARS